MNKIVYYAQAQEKLGIAKMPWSEGLELLEDMYNTQYVKIDLFDKTILGQLIELKLIETSSNKCTISALGQEFIELAASLYVEAENPVLDSKPRGSAKRKIHPEMIAIKDHALKYLEGKIETKGISEDRSNLFVNFAKRKKGIGCIEIKNKPEIRVSIRKPTPETIKLFESIGMTYRSTPNITYFDMEQTIENTELLIDTIVKYFKG